MKAIFKKISTSILVVLLSVSLTFSNTAAVTYQAAAIPVVYTAWEVLVVILALCGITIAVSGEQSDTDLQAQAAEELRMAYVMWLLQNGYKEPQGDNDGDGQDDVFASFDPLDYLTSSNQLYLDQDDLEAWQNFARAQGWTPTYVSNSDLNLYGCSYQEFLDYFQPLLSVYTSTSSGADTFLSNAYTQFAANSYSGVFIQFDAVRSANVCPVIHFYPLSSSSSYCIALNENFDMYCFYDSSFYVKGSNKTGGSNLLQHYWFNTSTLTASNTLDAIYDSGSNNFTVYALVVNGHFYDFYDIFKYPTNLTTSHDYGTMISVDDFLVPSDHFGNSISDAVSSIGDLDLSALVEAGTYDVVAPGRAYNEDTGQAEGDITVSMPSSESISSYASGETSLEDLYDEMGATAIDEASGINLFTQEYLTVQTGIFSGVNSIVGILQNIWAWLNNLIDSIVQAFIDMLLSLFVPADGFIDGKIGLITDKLDSLGVAPYDMSGIFDSDDGNPFQNIVIDLNGQEVVIVSFDYLPPFLNKFRPVIRGLLVLFLVYYSINQLLSLIRLSGMLEGGNFNTLQAGSGSNAPVLDVGMNTPKLTDKGGRV